jgi:hypothetical protein
MLMIRSLLILVDFVWNVNRVIPETSFSQHFSNVWDPGLLFAPGLEGY